MHCRVFESHMQHAHAEFRQRAEQRHFLHHNLSGAEDGDGVGPCLP